jgi:hypothetical protein
MVTGLSEWESIPQGCHQGYLLRMDCHDYVCVRHLCHNVYRISLRVFDGFLPSQSRDNIVARGCGVSPLNTPVLSPGCPASIP